MTKRAINLFLIALLCAALPLAAQETRKIERLQERPDTPQFERDISVTLQLIDVIAVDAAGRYINDLRKDEFTITVNGKPVPIRTFDAYFQGQRGGIEDLATGGIPDAIAPGRLIILFFDQAYSSFGSLRKAKAAAAEFVRRDLSPGDQIMVATYDRSFKVLESFTRDRDTIVETIEGLKFTSSISNRPGARFESETFFNTRLYLQALDKFALYLKAFRGRKTMIYLGEGYDQGLAFTTLNIYQRDMLDRFNDANTSIFSIDIAGLAVMGDSGSPAADAARNRRRNDTLSVFAHETGGTFYRGNNNIEKLILSIDTDISNYYVLGFYAEDQKDGSFREVSVSTSRPGVRLQNRRGYFAPKPFDQLSGDEKLVQLEEGFNRNAPLREFNVGFSANVFPRNDGSAVASIAVEAPLKNAGDQELELLGYVYSMDEKLVDAFHKRFSFKTAKPETVFHHVETANLVSGENLIKLVLRDNKTGLRSYHFINAKMPVLDAGLHASTIAFVSTAANRFDSGKAKVRSFKGDYDVPEREVADPLSPLTRSGIVIGAPDEIARGEVGVVLKISGLEARREEPKLQGTFSLRAGGAAPIKLETKQFKVYNVPGTNEAIVFTVLDLRDIAAGPYTLQAAIEDLQADRLVGQRAEITVR